MNSYFSGRQPASDQKLITEISERFKIDKILAGMLVSRGVDSAEKADKFLNCGLKNLNDPFLLDNMDIAVQKIKSAISGNKTIVIYGDYDADGICSVAILYLYFSSINVNTNWYIPEREEGYGINAEAVDFIKKEYDPGLIITVDCGITAHKEADYIKSLGIDLIITDHHNSCGNIPDCAVINPKVSKNYPFFDLCGAGVALKLTEALGGRGEAEKYIDIAAVATVADSVELKGENRDIVSEGLKKLNSDCRKGIKCLYDEAGVKDGFSTYTIAFCIAPRINAAGRIGQAKRALALFCEEDEGALNRLAADLGTANTERQQICEEIITKLKISAKESGAVYLNIIPAIDESRSAGVSGIVASRLCEEFYRPSFVFCETGDGLLKGSGRSIEGINIFDMLSSMADMLIKFGGHAYAAGVTIKKENYAEFVKRSDAYIKNLAGNGFFIKKQYYDYDLTNADFDSSLIKQLEIFEPCGVGNPRPKFLCKSNGLDARPLKNYPSHISFKLLNTDFMAFNFGNYLELLNSGEGNSLLFEFQQNLYNGRVYGKGYLKDFNYNAEASGIGDKALSNCILQLNCLSDNIPDIELYGYESLGGLIKEKLETFGTLIVVFFKKTLDSLYELCPETRDLKLSVFSCGDGNNLSRILLAPDANITAEGYRDIIFADTPVSSAYISRFLSGGGAVYIAGDKNTRLSGYGLDRETFVNYYKMISSSGETGKTFVNAANLYYNISKNNSGISLVQFTACYAVFFDLGIIYIDGGNNLCINKNIKRELESSPVYQKLRALLN